MREVILMALSLVLTMAVLLLLYDRATTPNCLVPQEDKIYMPQDWLVEPPSLRVKP